MERMVEEATNANKGTVAKATLDPANSTEAGARYGIGRVITFMLGQLSSRGAKARVIADSMIRRADPTTERKDVFKMLLSDSDYLDEAIEGFKGKREAWLNKEAKAVGRRIMLRAGIKAEGSNDRDLSDAMNDAATPEDNTSEQTKKAFGGSKTERDLPSKSQIGSLKLNPQEEHLYEHHVNNIKNGKFVRNDNGSVSTIFQTSIDIKGKTYNFPTVWDGKILSPHDAADRAIKEKGLDYWPSYKDPTEAETRYSKMHDVMAPDVNSLQNELGTPKE
jgi:hypothetical protein